MPQLTAASERKAEMKAKSGKTDLPQIFINGKYIGVRFLLYPHRGLHARFSPSIPQGYEELQGLEEDEKLNDLLATDQA